MRKHSKYKGIRFFRHSASLEVIELFEFSLFFESVFRNLSISSVF